MDPFAVLDAAALREALGRSPDTRLFTSPSRRTWVSLVTKDHAAPVSELHDHEADVYLVLEGEAELRLGGRLAEARTVGPGQHRGTGIEGGEARRLAPGSVAVIPEGTAHMVDARSGRLVYLVVKQDVGAR